MDRRQASGPTSQTGSFAASTWDLVGGLNPSEKYEFVNWDDYSQYMGKFQIDGNQTTNQGCSEEQTWHTTLRFSCRQDFGTQWMAGWNIHWFFPSCTRGDVVPNQFNIWGFPGFP